MKLGCNHDPIGRRSRGERGTSIVEILFASSIGILVLSALMVLFLEAAQEQSRGMVEAQLHNEIGLLQDRITRFLHQMSATESTIFSNPVESGSPFYQRIIVAQGKAPGAPREELIYDPQTMTLVHDPNRSADGDEVVFHEASSTTKLRRACFYPSMKPGGMPDSSSINVWLELDDDGASRRHNADGTVRRTSVVRTFVVTMRNQ